MLASRGGDEEDFGTSVERSLEAMDRPPKLVAAVAGAGANAGAGTQAGAGAKADAAGSPSAECAQAALNTAAPVTSMPLTAQEGVAGAAEAEHPELTPGDGVWGCQLRASGPAGRGVSGGACRQTHGCCTASASPMRSLGCLTSSLLIKSLADGETASGIFRSTLVIRCMAFTWLAAVNGGCPVSISNKSTPMAQISTVMSCGSLSTISGDR
mmetsp:Transcript_115986/g.368939  ORF Transcript_115986/g.368939 Transcript_115986/m.368939 type:complete len:212 (-) Transcript_115986:1246-1881(-)